MIGMCNNIGKTPGKETIHKKLSTAWFDSTYPTFPERTEF